MMMMVMIIFSLWGACASGDSWQSGEIYPSPISWNFQRGYLSVEAEGCGGKGDCEGFHWPASRMLEITPAISRNWLEEGGVCLGIV